MVRAAKWQVALTGAALTACWMGADLGFGGPGDDDDGGAGWDSTMGTDTYPVPEEADGGFLDPLTDLIWQDPPAFQLMRQYEARDYCEELIHGGRDDWYLPDVNQLRGLLRECGHGCPVHDPSCLHLGCEAPDS